MEARGELPAGSFEASPRPFPGLSALTAPTAASAGHSAPVHLVDVEERHIRRPGDLLAGALSLVLLVALLSIAILGPDTGAVVTDVVRDAVNASARQFLLLPIELAQGLAAFGIPVLLLTNQVIRRQWRVILRALAAALVGYLLAYLLLMWLGSLPVDHPLNLALSRNLRGFPIPGLAPFAAGIAALVTAIGRAAAPRVIVGSWWVLIIVEALAVLQSEQSLSGAVASLLLGRSIGFFARYATGVTSTRATGASLLAGIRRAGLHPDAVVRLDAHAPVTSWLVTSPRPDDDAPTSETVAQASTLDELFDLLSGGEHELLPTALPLPAQIGQLLASPLSPDPLGQYRRYAVFQRGARIDVLVLDGDRHVVGLLATLWDWVRLRSAHRSVAPSLRESARSAMLMSFAAREAGVSVPAPVGAARADDSIIILSRHIPGERALPANVPDDVVEDSWRQLRLAHDAGLAHRTLTGSRLRLDGDGNLWVLGWETGDIATSELSRRIDQVQLLTMWASLLGVDRAMASATRNLTDAELVSLAPLLQVITIPRETRSAMSRGMLRKLRARLVDLVPQAADAPSVDLQRLTFRKLLAISIAFAAFFILFGTFNWQQVGRAFATANPWLLGAAFVAGLSTYVGAAIGLKYFTPERLPFIRTLFVQVASSVVSLVAPAGVGPAGTDLRYLTREGVPVKLAAATVTLVQVTRIVSTLLLLLLVTALSGATNATGAMQIPSTAIAIGIGVAIATVTAVAAIPRVRMWVAARVGPTMRQIWPRVVWVVSDPARLGLGLVGNVIQTVGYVAAFGLALAAFGYTLPLATLTVAYLASASAGSAVPSPAGIGPVEVALTSGLTIAGIPSAAAVSVVLIFRVLTLWARIPLGILALRYLQKRNVL